MLLCEAERLTDENQELRNENDDGLCINNLHTIISSVRELIQIVREAIYAWIRINSKFMTEIEHPGGFGPGLDVISSLMNHFCSPNAYYSFEGLGLRVRSLRLIRNNPATATNPAGGFTYCKSPGAMDEFD